MSLQILQIQNFCIGVSNGLDALFLCLVSLGIGEGDEVLVPTNTFIATWLAVSMCGAKPVPVEPDINTFNINPHNIEKYISSRHELYFLFIYMGNLQI